MTKMSATQEVRQVQDRQVAVSDDDFAIMDYTEPEKDPESGAEEAGTQTDLGICRGGRCRGRKFVRRQMEMENDDCHFRSHHHEKKLMAMRWMKKMMWRRMMFRMCYGGPFGMGPGAGYGCRRRMRMMAATMMDSTDTSSNESGDRQEHDAGWRHRRCCRGRKFGRRFGDAKQLEDQATEKGKDDNAEAQVGNTEETNENIGWRHRRCCRGRQFGRRFGDAKHLEDQITEKGKDLAEAQVGNTEETNENTASAATSKDSVTVQTTPAQNMESAAGGRLHGRRGRRKEHMKWKCMRRGRFCEMSFDNSSSDSSSSESCSDENEPAHEIPKKHGGRHWRHGRRPHCHHDQTNAESNGDENEPADEVTKSKEHGGRHWRHERRHDHHLKQTNAEGNGDGTEPADEATKKHGGCHWRSGRRLHHHQGQTNAESNGDANEPADDVTKSKEHGERYWRRGGRHHQQTTEEGNGDERGENFTKARRAWKGRRFHKKMMKGMGRRGYFRCF